MDAWPWLSSLPSSPPLLRLASSSSKTLHLKADVTNDALSISVCILTDDVSVETLWASDSFPKDSLTTPLLLQLLREITALTPSPEANWLATPSPDEPDLPDLDIHSQFPNLFALLLLTRMFWICAFDAVADVGALYFRVLSSNLEAALDCRHAMRELLDWAGADWEALFMRALGYILAKFCVLCDTSPEYAAARRAACTFSYALDVHGLWALRGYAPVAALTVCHQHGQKELEATEPVLRYALAHQNLEAVFQFESTVGFEDERFIRVSVRVDNLRVHVRRLRFGGKGRYTEAEDESDERHFPSRIRLWLGPDPRSANSRRVTSLSIGKSTGNPVKEVEREHTMKGSFAKKSSPVLEAESRSLSREKSASWRWEQEAEGNTAVFEGVLCEVSSGAEVATWRGGGGVSAVDPRRGMRRRYSGPGRALSKGGGLVVAGDEFGQWVSWRVGRGMEGQVLNWRIGGKVWVSYCANEVRTSSYFETRFVEWQDELSLHLHRTSG